MSDEVCHCTSPKGKKPENSTEILHTNKFLKRRLSDNLNLMSDGADQKKDPARGYLTMFWKAFIWLDLFESRCSFPKQRLSLSGFFVTKPWLVVVLNLKIKTLLAKDRSRQLNNRVINFDRGLHRLYTSTNIRAMICMHSVIFFLKKKKNSYIGYDPLLTSYDRHLDRTETLVLAWSIHPSLYSVRKICIEVHVA